MPRTVEERQADEALREAVIASLRTYGWDDGGVLTDFVVIGSMTTYDDDCDQVSSTFTQHAEDSIPTYRLLGLCEYASSMYRAEVLEQRDDD
jgi:hypothetical protein